MTELRVPPETSRLRFRSYRLDDVESVMEMFDDEEAMRWYPTKSRRDEAIRWIEWNLTNYDDHGFGLWVVEDRVTRLFLGDCGLTFQGVEGESMIELGYHLQLRHRGNGFALEVAKACAAFALDHMRVEKLCSIVDPRNHASMRVAGSVHDSMRTFVNDAGNVWNLYWSDNPSVHSRPS